MKIPIILTNQEGRQMDGGNKMSEEKKKLEPGEKYLSIVLLDSIKVAAFKNKNKKNPKEPDYRGNGVVVWVNTKKAEETPIKTEEVI